MAEDKTEKPTQQKLKKAKEKGQVATSAFFTGTLVFFGALLLIWGMHTLFAERFQKTMYLAFQRLGNPRVEGAFQTVFSPLLQPVLFTLMGIFLIAIAANLVQTGWVFSIEQIKPKWRKKKRERRYLLPLLQLAVICGGGYMAIREKLDPTLLFASSQEQSLYIFKKLIFLAFTVGALLLFLGLCDFFYQKWRTYKKMHMTPEEKKQEQKESEGDPNLKRRMQDRRD